jgi:hypothetical protein
MKCYGMISVVVAAVRVVGKCLILNSSKQWNCKKEYQS